MALLPSTTQIPAQRVAINEPHGPINAKNPSSVPVYVSREWYRFFDLIHTYSPTPATFTPVFTPVFNVTSVTPGGCFYNQSGSVVSLTGSFNLTVAGAGNSVFRMTPPVLADLSLSTAAGTFIITTAGASDVGAVYSVGNELEFRLNAVTVGLATYVFNVNYQIV